MLIAENAVGVVAQCLESEHKNHIYKVYHYSLKGKSFCFKKLIKENKQQYTA